jgi:hypothetical protein
MASLISQLIQARWTHFAALVVVILSLTLPERGFGVPLCQFRNVTHLPCFGCGLTRSYIALGHLDVGRSVFYHPLGLVLFPATAFLASLLLTKAPTRARLLVWADKRKRALNYIGIGLLAFFLLYGCGRMLWLVITGRPSPW